MLQIQLPAFVSKLFDPYRYKILKGGRGGAKSYGIADAFLILGTQKREKFLCCREFQNSIKESVHSVLRTRIETHKMNSFYTVKERTIIGSNGTQFIYSGLARQFDAIRSMEGITRAWIDEAQKMSRQSFETLKPTIRRPGSEIWASFNPNSEDDPIYKDFFKDEPPPSTLRGTVNWRDNPWFPEVLNIDRLHMLRTNPELYRHVWEGECRTNSDAQIFNGHFIMDSFAPQKAWDGPYYGLDFGFSIDPTMLIKIWIDTHDNRIYIEKECGGVRIPLKKLPRLFHEKMPEASRRIIKGDCARPESINFLNSEPFRGQRFAVKPCEKWDGCVEDGIEVLKSFDKIVIHPSCTETFNEFSRYSYKIDRLTEEVTRDVEDSYNHTIDAIRYGIEKVITRRRGVLHM